MLPLAVAVLLTLAAGLSLAEEHPWGQAEAPAGVPQPTAASSSSPAVRHGEGASARHPVSTVGHDAAPAAGVGSRALTGDEAPDRPADRRP